MQYFRPQFQVEDSKLAGKGPYFQDHNNKIVGQFQTLMKFFEFIDLSLTALFKLYRET